MECGFFTRLKTHLTMGFSRKTNLNAVIMLYICETKQKFNGELVGLSYTEAKVDILIISLVCRWQNLVTYMIISIYNEF